MQRIGSALVILLGASSASADAPPTAPVVVDIVTAVGSGCPQGFVSITVDPDNTAFRVMYSSILAQVGVGAGPTDFRKNCQLSVLVHVPPGFTYAIAAVDYRGFASIAEGASATLRARRFFQGQPRPPAVDHTLVGPFVDDWRFTDPADPVDPAALEFAPCDAQRNLNLEVELRMAVGTSDPARTTSFITMDPPDPVGVPAIHHLVWKRCD